MEPGLIIYLLIAMAATTVGAVPLGLVNLSVMEKALKNDTHGAMQIALGASVVEVFFALSSLMAGAKLSPFFVGNPIVRYFVFAVLVVSGLFFWFKTNQQTTRKETGKSFGFLKGALLNIVSIQVLLFWLIVATVLSAKQLLPVTFSEILLFLTGVWLTKIAVLKGYTFVAQMVAARAQKISVKINRIIGVVLLVVAIVQLIKI